MINSVIVCGRTLTRALVSGVCSYSNTNTAAAASAVPSSPSSSSSSHNNNNKQEGGVPGQNNNLLGVGAGSSSSNSNSSVTLPLAWKKSANNCSQVKKTNNLCLLSASCGFPKDWQGFSTSLLKQGRFGDDACFVATNKTNDVLGVADGVGGWRSYGIDPSRFSLALMRSCERIVATGHFSPTSPAGIISAGYYELLENKEPIIGSSTACVLILNHLDGTVYAANIGDSGFLIVRRGRIVHRSQEQQHYFNTPFQLSLPPPGVGDMVLHDSPDTADLSSFSVEVGDLILLATDGLFDNLPDKAIVQQLSTLSEPHTTENIQKAVNSLALQARTLAFDASYLSPFAQRARDTGIDIWGGKPDDITVILASVGQQSQNDATVKSEADYG